MFRFVDVDSLKVDLSQELTNDFSNSLNGLLNCPDLQLNPDDFVSFIHRLFLLLCLSFIIQLLNVPNLSVDPMNCDDTFLMER